MSLSQVFRAINRLNPGTHGRGLMALIAERIAALPPSGVHTIQAGVRMELDTSEYIDRAIYFETFEVLSTRIIRRYLCPGDVFIDIGANVGYYSLLAKKQVGPSGRVLAFEPNPQTVKRLRRNTAINPGLEIEIFDVALSDRTEDVTLYSPPGSHSGETSLRKQDGWTAAVTTTASARRLDDIIPSDLPRVDCLKIDVEGAECLVLRGAERTIQAFMPSILLEMNERASSKFGHHRLDALKMLLDIHPGYRVQIITSHSTREVSLHELEMEYPDQFSANLWLLSEEAQTRGTNGD